MTPRLWILLAAGVMIAAPASARQDIADRVAAAPDGVVRMQFAAREGVCGDGENVWTRSRDEIDWTIDCDPGPVHLAVTVSGGRVRRVRTYVGGRWRAARDDVTDLGRVSAPAAAAFLMELAQTARDDLARRAIWPATLADSATVWPALLQIAGDETRGRRVRQTALLHAGMAAADAVPDDGGTAFPAAERKVREQAVFALSQFPSEQAVPMLLDIARTHRDAGIRRRALFWLGQSGDARAIQLFEEILRR